MKVLGKNPGRVSEYRCHLLPSVPQPEVQLVLAVADRGGTAQHLPAPHPSSSPASIGAALG